MLCYYNNGWVQPNAHRFALDFFPALVPLLALGAQRAPAFLLRATVSFAVGLNALAYAVYPWLGHLLRRL
jgi:hypothetical protein